LKSPEIPATIKEEQHRFNTQQLRQAKKTGMFHPEANSALPQTIMRDNYDPGMV